MLATAGEKHRKNNDTALYPVQEKKGIFLPEPNHQYNLIVLNGQGLLSRDINVQFFA